VSEPLVQQAYDRAKLLGDIVYVVTEASHAADLRAQLPELPDEAFLIERVVGGPHTVLCLR
jgi:hypothetical protein